MSASQSGQLVAQPAPAKPWENSQNNAYSPSASSIDAKPWERTTDANQSSSSYVSSPGTSQHSSIPSKPWERNPSSMALTTNNTYSNVYGTGQYSPYGSAYNSYGSTYGNNMYGSSYGNNYGYGYNRYMGSPYGGLGTLGVNSPYGSPYGSQFGPNLNMQMGGMPGQPAPPRQWGSILSSLNVLMGYFGNLAMLIDQNTHALHFFINALLQLVDRAGTLYGELARFIMRLLGFKIKPRAIGPPGQGQAPLLEGNGHQGGGASVAGRVASGAAIVGGIAAAASAVSGGGGNGKWDAIWAGSEAST